MSDKENSTMQLGPLFATPLAVFDASKFIDYGMSAFDDKKVSTLTANVGGFTTSLKMAPTGQFFADLPDAEEFKAFISECTKEFTDAIGYFTENSEFKVKRMWINEMYEGNFQNAHSHIDAVFSGCFYPQMPEGCSGITFHGPLMSVNWYNPATAESTAYNSMKYTMRPKAGDLLIWESHLRHEVMPANFDCARRCIGFDVSFDFMTTQETKMLETIAWIVFLMCLGAVIVVGVGIAIVMITREDI